MDLDGRKPVEELDTRFSSAGASPTPWPEARERLSEAEVFWLSTVRPDGRPHVTPLLSLWHNDALYFSTGTWFGLGDAIRAGDVLLYRATPTTVFGFGKGRQFSQTRWRF